MALLLLIVIYITFTSLGLPDGVLGSAWPSIQVDFNQPIGLGGLLAYIVSTMTVLSGLATPSLVRKLGVGKLMAISVGLTAFALLGFSQSSNILWLFCFVIPLGLGGGAIDSALNHYVAAHYQSHHMNWLHACWGLGATMGPIIFATGLVIGSDWHQGYLYLGAIQAAIAFLLLLSLPLWTKVKKLRGIHNSEDIDIKEVKFRFLLKESKVGYTFLTFIFYVGIEVGIGLWLASYLVKVQAMSVETASLWTGLYYGAITIGRLLSGFISFKLSSKLLIRSGIITSLVGAILLVCNVAPMLSLIGILCIGLGFAPIFPGLIHETPKRFGANKSAKVMSLQMVGGYLGASLIPPLIGFFAGSISMSAFAFIVPATILLMLISTELINKLQGTLSHIS